ncbi:MAG TPA: hypothetical protein VK465_05500, partial [Fibrobacteria bacterium]|nr:hypothetical protein [Fibrobacteria bacterium]
MKNVLLPMLMTSVLTVTSALGSLNRDGLPGINRTFSAKSLGHGRLGVGVHSHVVDDEAVVQNGRINVDGNAGRLEDYLTLNSSLFLSLGLGPFTDLSVALPLYYEKLNGTLSQLDLEQQKQGDLRYRFKVRAPFETTKALDLALVLGGTAPTQFDRAGVIPRELELMTNSPSDFTEGSSPFGAGRPTFMAALGLTLDLGRVVDKFQFLW